MPIIIAKIFMVFSILISTNLDYSLDPISSQTISCRLVTVAFFFLNQRPARSPIDNNLKMNHRKNWPLVELICYILLDCSNFWHIVGNLAYLKNAEIFKAFLDYSLDHHHTTQNSQIFHNLPRTFRRQGLLNYWQ